MADDAHIIKVGTRGWDRDRAALYVTDVGAGIGVLWVEVDGHRFASEIANVVRLEFAGDKFTTVDVSFIGRCEIVYCDADGEPLP